MKNISVLALLNLCFLSSAQAASVSGYFIPDRIVTDAKGSLAYLVENSGEDDLQSYDVKFRAEKIAALLKLTRKMTSAEKATADALGYDVDADLALASKLNFANTEKSRAGLRELAQKYLSL